MAPQTVVVQPAARGTAPAIVYGLTRLGALGHDGPVAVLPSDHYVSDDLRFMDAVGAAVDATRQHQRVHLSQSGRRHLSFLSCSCCSERDDHEEDCAEVQGYYFGYPASAEQIREIVASGYAQVPGHAGDARQAKEQSRRAKFTQIVGGKAGHSAA